MARFVLRRAYRRACGGGKLQATVLLLGGYMPKLRALGESFRAFGVHVVYLDPKVATQGADVIADLLDSKCFAVEYVVPLVECVVAVSDELNRRLGDRGNDPSTSPLRRDKFAQQESLRALGLAASAQALVWVAEDASTAAAAVFSASCGQQVVVKPRDASGGDGIWLCSTQAAVVRAVEREMGRLNIEGSLNKALICMEAFVGEEWVVNSVSAHGIHKVTDVWKGPPKVILTDDSDSGLGQFLYSEQFLANSCPRRAAVLEYCAQVLDAVGVRSGAAHTEIVWTAQGPRLLEVNARPAGGLPRTPLWPNQLQALAMSQYMRGRFLALPGIPGVASSEDEGRAPDRGAAVVFLRAPLDGWLLGSALDGMMALRTFQRFERNLFGIRPGAMRPRPLHVTKTTGLFSSPGAVVLHGTAADVRLDAAEIRKIEATAYAHSPCEPAPADADASADAV